jgi:hypothetical protein
MIRTIATAWMLLKDQRNGSTESLVRAIGIRYRTNPVARVFYSVPGLPVLVRKARTLWLPHWRHFSCLMNAAIGASGFSPKQGRRLQFRPMLNHHTFHPASGLAAIFVPNAT